MRAGLRTMGKRFVSISVFSLGLFLAAAIVPAQTLPTATATAPLAATTQPSTTSAPVPAPFPATAPAPNPLIDALSSPDPRDRRHAAEDLLKLGESARPLLENLLKQTTDLDVITRANATLAQLDENRMIGPSYVTLHFKNVPARDVAEALGQQAFAPLRVFPENLWDDPAIPKVTIDVDHQPFWTAMRQFTEQTGLDLNPYADGVRLMRRSGDPAGSRWCAGRSSSSRPRSHECRPCSSGRTAANIRTSRCK